MQINFRRTFRAGKIKGTGVRNAVGQHVGEINDLVIDVESNRILYGILGDGGFCGMGVSQFVIPWEEYSLQFDEDRKYFLLDIDPAKLAKTKGVDWRHCDFTDPEQARRFEEIYRGLRREGREHEAAAARPGTASRPPGYSAGPPASTDRALEPQPSPQRSTGEFEERTSPSAGRF